MNGADDTRWFTKFQVDQTGAPDSEFVWTDAPSVSRFVRTPTRTEKLSILLVGVGAIGFIVLMAVTLIVAVYIARH